MDQRQLFLRHVAQTSPAPLALEVVRAEGCRLTGVDGRSWLDLIGGISVCNLGHGHPKVLEAVHAQVDRYLHVMVYGELVLSPQVAYARRLASLLPDTLDSVYFTSSGAEAVEGAMKLAKRLTGRPVIAGFRQSYHGSTQGALSLLGDEYWRSAYRPLLPGIRELEHGSWDDLSSIGPDTACVVAEVVQAERGVVRPPDGWLQALRARCDATGALLVFDEIQTGFGRTGGLWAFEAAGVVPDILLLGKALGAGMPLGAFIASRDRMAVLTADPVLGHITTFGGHPVSCAAGLAGLEALLGEGHLAAVGGKALLFRERLRHPLIRSLRQEGLLMAVEFGDAGTCQRIIGRCVEGGVLTDWFLFAPHCLRLAPPLTIGEAEIGEACAIILSACGEEAAASEAQAEAAEETEALVAHVGQRAGGGPPDEVEPEEA
jgi:acetylornithine/succinyldiaminopimelate/putrescine aminotransferase